jgi:pimeloyl-ACP methyl ester carboxylesterase
VNVVFLHAFPLDGRMWEAQVGRFDGIAPTLYGLGGPSLEEWARALLGRVEGDVALVGSSMGGYTALAAARLAPDRVKALVLVGARADADTPERRAARDETIRLIRDGGVQALWEEMRSKLFSAAAPPELLARARTVALDQRPDQLIRATEAMRDRADSTELLRSFPGRLLVVVGDEDPFASPADFTGVVPPERLRVIESAGHLVSMERPELFNDLLEEVLR